MSAFSKPGKQFLSAATASVFIAAASSGAAWAQTENGGKRLAFSQRLGAEVFTVESESTWCRETVAVQVVADSKTLFERPDFDALLKSLGARVLAKECPAARRLTISGYEKGSAAAVWAGAAAGDEWKAVADEPPTANETDAESRRNAAAEPDAPPAAAPADETPRSAPPQRPALPTASSPLGGEWTAFADCGYNGGKTTATLSVYEANGVRFKAVWEKRTETGRVDRQYVVGQYDDLSRQTAFQTAENGIIRTGDGNSVNIPGKFDPAASEWALRNVCYGDAAFKLARVSKTPITAHRVLSDQALRETWIEEESRRPREWRIFGKAPPGAARVPGCAELTAWAETFPVDQRVRLFPNNNSGVLRHYDDATTQRLFGSPAYHWLNNEALQILQNTARDSCGFAAYHSSDPRMRRLQTVVADFTSSNMLEERRRYDRILDSIGPHLATRGDSPEEATVNLDRFSSIDLVARNIHEFRISASALTPEDKTGVVRDVARYKRKTAEKAGEAATAEIAGLPATADSLDRLTAIAARSIKLFGAEAAAPVVKAAAARRLEIGKALVETAVNDMAAARRDFDGMVDVDLKLSALRARLTPADGKPDAAVAQLLKDLDAAETRYREEARDEVVKAARKALADVPASAEGAQTIHAQMQGLEKALGKDAGPQFPAYKKAAAERLEQIGAALAPALKDELAALPTEWDSIGKARDLAARRAAPFAGLAVETGYRKAGEDRAVEVLGALADQAALDLREIGAPGVPGIDEVLRETDAAAQAFLGVESGAPFAERIQEAGRKRADALAENYLPELRAEIKLAQPSKQIAVQLAAVSIAMDQRAKRVPAAGKLRDLARDAATAMYGGLCDKATAAADISASQGRMPVLVGSEITTLRQFACDLNEGGIRPAKLETPGIMTSLSGGEKVYVLRVYGSEEKIQAAMARRIGEMLFGKGKARRFEDLFSLSTGAGADGGEQPFETPAKIVFKEIEVRQNQNALVGVQFGDEGKTESMSIRQWREFSQTLASLGKDGVNPAELCAAWNKNGPQNTAPYDAGLALLTCQTKK